MCVHIGPDMWHVWRSEGNFRVLTFHYMGSGVKEACAASIVSSWAILLALNEFNRWF